jgi:hypothetical protein
VASSRSVRQRQMGARRCRGVVGRGGRIWGGRDSGGQTTERLAGSEEFVAVFSETRHGSRILDNRCRSVNAAGHKRALLKR